MKIKKFIGPTKKMKDALKAEGLDIKWPDKISVEEDLAIEGFYYTGCDWEKIVIIDLRDKDLSSKEKVDFEVYTQLREAYENYDVNEEMHLNMQGTQEERESRGVPDADILLEDLREAENRLKRFYDVACAVAYDRPIPQDERHCKNITITLEEAKNIARLMCCDSEFMTDNDYDLLIHLKEKLQQEINNAEE